MEYIVVITTTETAEDAGRIADELVTRKLAACVQVVGPIRSVYRWQGKVEASEEYRCEMKTHAACFDKIRQLISEVHPYNVPELIAMPISHISPTYAQWLSEQLG